ncbi:MAG: DUF6587 family protein [Burkholderia sp.]
MSAGLAVQYGVIAVIVAASCAVMVRKLAPAASARGTAALAAYLAAPGRAGWMRWLGARLSRSGVSGGGCDSGCSTCGGCGTSDAPATNDEMPLTFKPRAGQER